MRKIARQRIYYELLRQQGTLEAESILVKTEAELEAFILHRIEDLALHIVEMFLVAPDNYKEYRNKVAWELKVIAQPITWKGKKAKKSIYNKLFADTGIKKAAFSKYAGSVVKFLMSMNIELRTISFDVISEGIEVLRRKIMPLLTDIDFMNILEDVFEAVIDNCFKEIGLELPPTVFL